MNSVNPARSTACTWGQTLDDLLDNSPAESRAIVLDEGVTNLRELVDRVIALLTPFVSRSDLRLSASVDQMVAETIFADSARLGQIVFHLLYRAAQLSRRGEILLVVWAQPVSQGSQHIFFDIVEEGEKGSSTAQLGFLGFATDDREASRRPGGADAYLPLCQRLAQRMQGELTIASGEEAEVRASFHAPFAVEQLRPSSGSACGNAPAPPCPGAAQPGDVSAGAAFEPFELRYLHALSNEGVDLHVFLDNWRQAMRDDLERLTVLRREGGDDHLHGVLHRLSGAVGLVGACHLMEALRRASVAPLEQKDNSLDMLMERARILITQLEIAVNATGSTSRRRGDWP